MLGWLRDMYAFSIALVRRKIKVDLTPIPDNLLMTQPPHDDKLGKAAILHYTWGALMYTSDVSPSCIFQLKNSD